VGCPYQQRAKALFMGRFFQQYLQRKPMIATSQIFKRSVLGETVPKTTTPDGTIDDLHGRLVEEGCFHRSYDELQTLFQ
jgi:hypothetical protein